MTDRNQICPNDRASTVTDVLARPCKWQTPFSERDDASKRIKTHHQQVPKACHSAEHRRSHCKMSFLYHLAVQCEALVILLQETHGTSAQRLVLPDYQLAGFSKQEAWSCYVCPRTTEVDLFRPISTYIGDRMVCVDIDGYKIVNVYICSPIFLQVSDLPVFPHPCLYAGDFNCQHVDWGYDANSADGKWLVG